jgi:single-stranded-DNA-specific exonuclease
MGGMSLPRCRFAVPPYDYAAATRLSEALGVSHPLAAILVRRGHGEPEAARRFLAADEHHDPGGFAGIGAACEAILRHVASGSRIVVHGDYDVDGVCSTAVLVRALRRLGAEPGWYLPSRADDGYGLSRATVERLAADGTGLLLTVDCGITCAPEVARARELGVEVVVTDHHRPGEALPDCPIVHPALSGYPCADLCAAAVAHKLAEALFARAGADPAPLADDLDLVALATICDVVPLAGENRRLAREGLRALARTTKPGLRALMRVASLDPGAGLTARDAGFRLGPRLNAAGRLERADAALELVLTEDERRAAEVADELDLLNRERQDVESRILFAAESMRAAQDAQAAFVLAGEDWHPGVIGIVASRLVERHHRPCVLIAIGADGGRGSGRSIPAYDLHAGLTACSPLLRRFGGHRAAAGLEIDPARVDDLRRELAAHAAAALAPQDLVPVQRVDAVVGARELGLGLAEELDRLEPFGQGNPEPVLLVPASRAASPRPMGPEGQHARFSLVGAGAVAQAVAFRTGAGSLRALGDEPHDVAVRLEANAWNGRVEPRVVLRGAAPARGGPCEVVGEGEFWALVEEELGREAPGAVPVPAGGPARLVRDARGAGAAAVAAELLSSGERVLLACAHPGRRREAIERLLGGLAAGRLALCSWDALARDPGLAREYEHLVALDPPPLPGAEAIAAAAPCPPGRGHLHLAWGPADADFALRVAEDELELRPALVEAFRALREAGGELRAEALERALRGGGRHPRSAATCGRMLRVLRELGLAEVDASGRTCRTLAAEQTELERSPAYRAYRARLDDVRAHLTRDGTAARAA